MNPISLLSFLRWHQWLKNSFVLAGVVFSASWNQVATLQMAGIAFVAFCAISSAVYVLNDFVDREKDKLHPIKKHRLLAAGKISTGAALAMSFFLGAIGLGLSGLVGLPLLGITIGYLVLNILYSFSLKNVPIVDLFCISLGFLLRILAGSWAIGVEPSHWILLCTFMLSLFLASSKRYSELLQFQNSPRPVLEFYSNDILKMLMAITLSCTLLGYSLYTVSPRTHSTHPSGLMLMTVPLVTFCLLRYIYMVLQHKFGEDPAKEIWKDPWLFVASLAYGIAAIFAVG